MRRRFLLWTLIADFVSLVVAMAVGFYYTFGIVLPWNVESLPSSPVPFIVAFLVGAAVGSYVSQRLWVTTVPRPSYVRAVLIFAITIAFVSIVIVLFRPYWSRSVMFVTAIAWLGLMVPYRFIRRRRPWSETYVVVSREDQLVADLAGTPHAVVLTTIDPQHEGDIEPLPDGAGLVVDHRSVFSDRVSRYVSSCTLAGLRVMSFAGVYEEHTGKFVIVHLAEGWEMAPAVDRSSIYEPFKRLIDTVLVVLSLPFVLLIGVPTALLIKATSPGPVVFRQERVGLHGRPFTLYKFRTMREDAEVGGPQFADDSDDRITPVGAVLRKFRVDELPQLWNVLRGELSVVGPRPEQVEFARRFATEIPFYDERHLVRPGITGWAQVNQGYAATTEETMEKLRYDLFYVKHMGFWLDIRILGKTIWTVAAGDGAK